MENKFKAVIFDMDGVIFDTESIWKKIFKQTNKIYNVNLSEKIRQSFCGKKQQEVTKHIMELLPKINAQEYIDTMENLVDEELFKNGAPLKTNNFISIINDFKKHNLKLGLATGCQRNRMEHLFKKAGLNPYEIFDAITTENDVTDGKPHPMLYTKTIDKLKLLPSECVVIEDSINGIISAIKADCKAIMVVDLIKPTKEISKQCEKVFTSLEQAHEYIVSDI